MVGALLTALGFAVGAAAWGWVTLAALVVTLPHADWMPVAALAAMKPSLPQSTLAAEQRLAGAVLIGMDLPHPSDPAREGRRVLFTLIGGGIALVVLLLANLVGKRSQAGARPAPAG